MILETKYNCNEEIRIYLGTDKYQTNTLTNEK